LLKKYGLSYLQPLTYDLASERESFLREFTKIEFTLQLQTFLLQFDFEDSPFVLQKDKLLK
jgi:hypothetical protein